MSIHIKQTNMSLSPAEQLLLEEKLSVLHKFFTKITQIRVEVEKDRHHRTGEIYRVEANIQIPNRLLRLEKSATDWRAALELVKDHAKRLLVEEKNKLLKKRRSGSTIPTILIPEEQHLEG